MLRGIPDKARARVESLVAAKREAHPELARPLTWPRLRTVCKREGVHLCLADLPPEQPAQLVPFFARWSILVADSLAPRERVRLAAHELAHLWAHHDPQHERWELVYQIEPHAATGPAESEAWAITHLLIEGAKELPPLPQPSPRGLVRSVPPVADPYTAPPVIAARRRAPRYGPPGDSALEAALRRQRPKLPRPMRGGPPSDHGIIEHTAEGRCFFTDDQDGIRWEVRDVAFFDVGGERRREVVKAGNLAAKFRYFLNRYAGEQRVYRFARWELRDVRVHHLERQFRESIRLETAGAARQRKNA